MKRPKWTTPEPCEHRWAGDYDGTMPQFVFNRQLSSGLIAPVVCLDCDARTWLNPSQWAAHAEADTQPEEPPPAPMSMTDPDRTMEVYREVHPEEVARIDAIAEIIDPGAFPGEAWDGTGPEAKRIQWEDSPRCRYMRSVARSKAHRILKYLGLAEEIDWVEILRRLSEIEDPEIGATDEQ